MSFTQKTVIITGATRGIGLGIAQIFASQGARTILIGRDPSRVQQVQDSFREKYSHQTHEGIVLDVSNKEAIDSVLKVRDWNRDCSRSFFTNKRTHQNIIK
jgi:NAD(P)-dependent dehydrogenase (short-subunit alcohol dehydrogenase family)